MKGARFSCLVCLLAVAGCLGGCLPGFFPLLPESERRAEIVLDAPFSAAENYRRATAFLGGEYGRSLSVVRPVFSPERNEAYARLGGGCKWPGDDLDWLLSADMSLRAEDGRITLSFSKTVLLHRYATHDQPGLLVAGHKRAPRNQAQMEYIKGACLEPISRKLGEVAAKPF